MTMRRWIAGLALGSVLLMSGCRHCCKRPNPTMGPPGPIGAPAPRTLPPQGIPLDPPPSTGMKPEVLLPQSMPPTTSSPSNLPKFNGGSARLGEPDFNIQPAVSEEKSTIVKPPPAAMGDPLASALPVGIAQFAQVKENVSSGQRPDLDGLDWLHTKGYKTVVFLRSGTEDDSSDRKQVTDRGMKYQTLTVKPESINPTSVAEFNRLVNDAEGRPIFIYDFSGKQAGAMWYLYFRTSELLNDDEARVRAGRHGLKNPGDAEQTRLWTAVQKYLSER